MPGPAPCPEDGALPASGVDRLRARAHTRRMVRCGALGGLVVFACAAALGGLAPWWLALPVAVAALVAWRQWRRFEEAAFEALDELEAGRCAAVAAAVSKAQFLANMSHEIRTPMNGVLGMAELLVRTDLGPEQAQMATTIQASAEALLAVLNDILDYSKIEAGKVELERAEFDLWQIVDDSAGLLHGAAAQKGVELLTFTDPRLSRRLVGDSARIRQILLNFLGNAVKFTIEGEVVLAADLVADEPSGQRVRLSVRDTGVGIDPEVLQRLFAPFTQADASTTRRFGGTGLGLAICRRLAELMGGTIGVDSRSGRGSTFWVEVVLPHGSPQDAVAEAPDVDLSQHAVLVVDDNETNRQLMLMQLAPTRIGIDVADNAVSAVQVLRLAASRGRPFTMAILDMAMPGVDGMQLARAIRDDRAIPDLCIAIASSLGLSPGLAAMAEADVFRWLNKPLSAGRLLQVVRDMARLRAGMSGAAGESNHPVAAAVAVDALTGLRVLVAEDNEINRRVLAGMLQRLGCEPTFAVDGGEAVQFASEAVFDVILMDCQMPVLDGYEATRRIRAAGGKAPILALTANVLPSDREACLAAGMEDFLAKPVKLDILRAALQRWTGGLRASRAPANGGPVSTQ